MPLASWQWRKAQDGTHLRTCCLGLRLLTTMRTTMHRFLSLAENPSSNFPRVSWGSWGGLQELSLCLRSNNVLVVCIRTLELDKTSRAEKCCKIVNFFPPERPVYVICAVSVEDKHWDLGVVSSPDHGWNALFPIDSWHDSCQKIIDFLLHDKKQKFAWKPPATNGLPSPLTALFLPPPLPPPTFFFH